MDRHYVGSRASLFPSVVAIEEGRRAPLHNLVATPRHLLPYLWGPNRGALEALATALLLHSLPQKASWHHLVSLFDREVVGQLGAEWVLSAETVRAWWAQRLPACRAGQFYQRQEAC